MHATLHASHRFSRSGVHPPKTCRVTERRTVLPLNFRWGSLHDAVMFTKIKNGRWYYTGGQLGTVLPNHHGAMSHCGHTQCLTHKCMLRLFVHTFIGLRLSHSTPRFHATVRSSSHNCCFCDCHTAHVRTTHFCNQLTMHYTPTSISKFQMHHAMSNGGSAMDDSGIFCCAPPIRRNL